MGIKFKTFVLVNGFLMSVALAGWFGPGDSDKEKVTVILLTEKKECDAGFFPFEIHNGSDYVVDKVDFTVIGKISGRSTEYDLRWANQDFESDFILQPKKSTKTCFKLNSAMWPQGERLLITPKVTAVIFQ